MSQKPQDYRHSFPDAELVEMLAGEKPTPPNAAAFMNALPSQERMKLVMLADARKRQSAQRKPK